MTGYFGRWGPHTPRCEFFEAQDAREQPEDSYVRWWWHLLRFGAIVTLASWILGMIASC